MPRKNRRTAKIKVPWARHIQPFNLTQTSRVTILCENSSAMTTPVPSIITAGNFKCQGHFNLPSSYEGSYDSYCFLIIFFLPEGISITSNPDIEQWCKRHPEFVLVWHALNPSPQIGSETIIPSSAFQCSSRLKRKLNSGDRICMGCYSNGAMHINGMVEWFTKSN